MKLKCYYVGEEHVFEDEDDLRKFVIREVDSEYLSDYLDDNFEGYEDNLNEWSPSDLYNYIIGNCESVRDDEDLWEWLCDLYDTTYRGFDADDYDSDETTCTIGDLEFEIEFEDGEREEDEDAE